MALIGLTSLEISSDWLSSVEKHMERQCVNLGRMAKWENGRLSPLFVFFRCS